MRSPRTLQPTVVPTRTTRRASCAASSRPWGLSALMTATARSAFGPDGR